MPWTSVCGGRKLRRNCEQRRGVSGFIRSEEKAKSILFFLFPFYKLFSYISVCKKTILPPWIIRLTDHSIFNAVTSYLTEGTQNKKSGDVIKSLLKPGIKRKFRPQLGTK
ncbi:hypothetical protein V8G54_031986 [Vigna mungo]|uniref:Uncharacterized protein n=1 Tax=Vigna mungo TaxID=3915 RepID=A0AAQ3REZ1_VIGMU